MKRRLDNPGQGLLVPAFAAALVLMSPTSQAQGCTTSWSSQQYKSFAQINSEIQRRYGNAQILTVKLCGSGASARFRVKIKRSSNGGVRKQQVVISAR